jgi:hypothetical protein
MLFYFELQPITTIKKFKITPQITAQNLNFPSQMKIFPLLVNTAPKSVFISLHFLSIKDIFGL